MTVKEYIKDHHNIMLKMMTPIGYINISASDLVSMDKVQTNPGCSGSDMIIESAAILEMDIVYANTNEDSVSMLVE